MTRMRDLLSMFYWPIYMRLVAFDVSKNTELLYEIKIIIQEQMGKAAPKTIIAEPIVRLLRYIENEKFNYPMDITDAFGTRTFEIQKQYNDIFFK